MNSSPQRIVVIVVAVLALGGGALFMFDSIFLTPWLEASNRRSVLESDVDKLQKDKSQAEADKRNSVKWNKLSLPSDFGRASTEYARMLEPLLRDCGLVIDKLKPSDKAEPLATSGQKKSKHTLLTFDVTAHGTVESLAKALEALQRLPVMHRVSTMKVERADAKDKTSKLNVIMRIEAVIVHGTNNQPKLTGAKDVGPALTARKYVDVSLRNPFVGYVPPPPPPQPPMVVEKKKEEPPPEVEEREVLDIREFISLESITLNEGVDSNGPEAYLRSAAQRSAPLRVRSKAQSGYDTFRIYDDDRKVLLTAKVLRIEQRDMYYQVGEDVFGMHVRAQSLADSLRRPMNDAQVEKLGLKSLIDPDFAKKGNGKTKGKKG